MRPVSLLGKGAFGFVWKAQKQQQSADNEDEFVAIKLPQKKSIGTFEAKEMSLMRYILRNIRVSDRSSSISMRCTTD